MKHDFYIGQEICEEKIFSSEDVEYYSKISGDCNPIHLDREYAKKSQFGKRIVHGLLLSSLFSKMIGMDMPGEGSIYMEQNLRFRRPVFINEKVIAKISIIDIDIKKNIFSLKTNIYNDKNECAIEGTAKVLYKK